MSSPSKEELLQRIVDHFNELRKTLSPEEYGAALNNTSLSLGGPGATTYSKSKRKNKK